MQRSHEAKALAKAQVINAIAAADARRDDEDTQEAAIMLVGALVPRFPIVEEEEDAIVPGHGVIGEEGGAVAAGMANPGAERRAREGGAVTVATTAGEGRAREQAEVRVAVLGSRAGDGQDGALSGDGFTVTVQSDEGGNAIDRASRGQSAPAGGVLRAKGVSGQQSEDNSSTVARTATVAPDDRAASAAPSIRSDRGGGATAVLPPASIGPGR